MTLMTFIKSKYNFIALFSLLFLLIYIVPVQAEPKNVLDCIENEEECEEQADELVDINESNNNELIENESFQSTSLVFNIVKMIVALFFVLALIYAILLILRK